jgi:hypothetical protein
MNLKDTVEKHALWSQDSTTGDLCGADLCDLCGADLRGADLRGADLCDLCGADLCDLCDLCGADLRGADLRGADLRDLREVALYKAIGNGVEICTMQIGCQRHTYEEWDSFSDIEISSMHSIALAFWKEHKKWLFEVREHLFPSPGGENR